MSPMRLFLRPVLAMIALISLAVCRLFIPVASTMQTVPAGAWKTFKEPTSMTLYSIETSPYVDGPNGKRVLASDQKPKFHRYPILGQIALESPATQKRVTKALRQAVRRWDENVAACFEPRHGVRVTDEAGTYDFVICFHCSSMLVYPPSGERLSVGITSKGQPLTDLLKAAQIPIAP